MDFEDILPQRKISNAIWGLLSKSQRVSIGLKSVSIATNKKKHCYSMNINPMIKRTTLNCFRVQKNIFSKELASLTCLDILLTMVESVTGAYGSP
jgi:hypothetical protein